MTPHMSIKLQNGRINRKKLHFDFLARDQIVTKREHDDLKTISRRFQYGLEVKIH